MNPKKLIITLSLTVAAAAFSQVASVAYFNPQSTTVSNGKFVLVAVKEKVTTNGREYDDYFYRFARIKVGTDNQLRLVSSRIFGAFSNEPDYRGYGPVHTQTSKRDIGDGLVRAELIATTFEARKWTDTVVLKYDKNHGIYKQSREYSKFIKDTKANIEKEFDVGLTKQLGANYRDNYNFYNYDGGATLVEKNWGEDAKKEPYTEATSTNVSIGDPESSGEKQDGFIVDIHKDVSITKRTDDNETYDASYSVKVRVNMLSNGRYDLSVISKEVVLPKDGESVSPLAPLNAQEAKLTPAQLKAANDEAAAIVAAKIVTPEQEGNVEAVPANER